MKEIITACISMFIVVFVCLYLPMKHHCEVLGERMGVNTRYFVTTFCMAEYEEGKWISVDNVIVEIR